MVPDLVFSVVEIDTVCTRLKDIVDEFSYDHIFAAVLEAIITMHGYAGVHQIDMIFIDDLIGSTMERLHELEPDFDDTITRFLSFQKNDENV
jgi:hypothetical protein